MVFKKLTDLTSRATNTLIHGTETAEKIHQLESMGFDAQRAKHALNATGKSEFVLFYDMNSCVQYC